MQLMNVCCYLICCVCVCVCVCVVLPVKKMTMVPLVEKVNPCLHQLNHRLYPCKLHPLKNNIQKLNLLDQVFCVQLLELCVQLLLLKDQSTMAWNSGTVPVIIRTVGTYDLYKLLTVGKPPPPPNVASHFNCSTVFLCVYNSPCCCKL